MVFSMTGYTHDITISRARHNEYHNQHSLHWTGKFIIIGRAFTILTYRLGNFNLRADLFEKTKTLSSTDLL